MKTFSALFATLLLPLSLTAAEASALFARSNLVAWCIVPFDAKQRGPEERAAMLERLGFKQFAYDYRAEHIPTFDAELEALKRHNVRLVAWWFPTTLNDEARQSLATLQRHKLRQVQLWVMGGGEPTANAAEQTQRVAHEAERIRLIAEAANNIGCSVALFAWAGGPDRGAELLQAVPFAKRDSYILFEFKVLTLAAVMVYALLRFTWAIRQFNLVSILIGAYSRENKSPIIQQPDVEDAQLITRAARLNELAGTNFTQGLRAYYYAVPLLMWLANAWLLILGSLAITFASYYMEFRSDTVKALSAEYNPEDSLIKDTAPGK